VNTVKGVKAFPLNFLILKNGHLVRRVYCKWVHSIHRGEARNVYVADMQRKYSDFYKTTSVHILHCFDYGVTQ
jgi:hypothetical protein